MVRGREENPHPDLLPTGLFCYFGVSMTREIRPLESDDLGDLSRFLTAGFHTAPDADFAAPEVLRWKYLEPWDEGEDRGPRSYLARDEAGKLIGHVGTCATAFEGAAIPGGSVATLHMIDLLGSAGHRLVGVSLMRKVHEATPTQFGIGGSDAGRKVGRRGGYEPRGRIPVYQRVIRPAHWLRVSGLGPAERASRLGRDLGRNLLLPARTARFPIELRRVEAFDATIEPIVEEAKAHAILTSREPGRLNHLLRLPRQSMTGWYLVGPGDRLRGFAVLNLVPQHGGRVRLGKIVDCLLEGTDVELWHAAACALLRELARQGADAAQAFAGTPWMAEGLRRAGLASRFSLEFSLRDRQGLIPRGIPLHLTPIEADYAYM
jgi:hypothetical protein